VTNRAGKIIAFEQGQLSDTEIIDLFQEMIDDGSVWSLQGTYGRAARSLICNGYCSMPEEHSGR
jgi:hypothetical protein